MKLIPGGGALEICVNGELIHSKLETGEWPAFDAIAQRIKSKSGKSYSSSRTAQRAVPPTTVFSESEGCLVALAVFKTVVGPFCGPW